MVDAAWVAIGVTVVGAVLGWNGWLHAQLWGLRSANRELAVQVETLTRLGTDGTIQAAISDLAAQVRSLNGRVESDFQRIALCLVQLSNGKPLTMQEILRHP